MVVCPLRSRPTSLGDIFASIDKMHWRLLKINGVIFSNDPLRLRKPTWKLVRTRGQTFHKVSTAISQKFQKNWILANFKLPEIKRPLTIPSSSTIRQKTIKASELKQKLKTLKSLFDEGLIDQKEYREKKKKVMNQNF